MPLFRKSKVVTEQPKAANEQVSKRPQPVIKTREFDVMNDVTAVMVRQLIHYDIKEACGKGSTYNVWSESGELLFYAIEAEIMGSA